MPMDSEKESKEKATERMKRKTSKAREDKIKRQKTKDDPEKLTLMEYVQVVSDFEEAINVIPLAVKSLIVSWKSYCKGDMGFYEIHRADGNYKTYKFFSEMLNDFDRDDLIVLYRLFNEKVHSLMLREVTIYMLVEKKYLLPHDTLTRMLRWKLHVNYEIPEMAYKLLKFIIFMEIIRDQQKALDDDLVAPTNRLKIGKFNLRLSSNLNSKEPTLQVVLDALKLTSFYKAFEITVDVSEIYMQEFWVIASIHHSSLHFKLNDKSHSVNVDNFRDMLLICPKLLGQKFEDPPFEEEILSFIGELGHTGEIKVLFDVSVNHMHQPWRSFAAIINKCLSGKTTALESL
ncbi:hypothetical protein Tco_1318361 [Tanacetum coccineum]